MAKKTIYKSSTMQIDAIMRFSEAIKAASARELQNELQNVIHSEILGVIDKGLSPVKGYRNFAKYKNPKRYPADRKPSNKPNLRLTGEMLANYKAKAQVRNELSATMGIHQDASERSQLLTKVHNDGTKHIAMRRFIPKQSAGETYTAKINAAIRRAFEYVLSRAIKSGRGQK
jgi:hypothetical protein